MSNRIKNTFSEDKNFFIMKNKTFDEILFNFCSINEENEIVIDYRYFKLLCLTKSMNYDTINEYVIKLMQKVLLNNSVFVVHLCLKSLTIADVDKHYKFICKISEILKTTFPDKLEKCFVYKAPFIFSQLFTIISAFVDKTTLDKLELVK
jgi:hypothetical protein